MLPFRELLFIVEVLPPAKLYTTCLRTNYTRIKDESSTFDKITFLNRPTNKKSMNSGRNIFWYLVHQTRSSQIVSPLYNKRGPKTLSSALCGLFDSRERILRPGSKVQRPLFEMLAGLTETVEHIMLTCIGRKMSQEKIIVPISRQTLQRGMW